MDVAAGEREVAHTVPRQQLDPPGAGLPLGVDKPDPPNSIGSGSYIVKAHRILDP